MSESELMDMIIYYSRLMTGRILKHLYLNYGADDLKYELRLLILSVNDALTKGELISSMMIGTECIIPDETVCYLEKQKDKIKGIGNYLKQYRSSSHKKDKRNDFSTLIDEAVHVCSKGDEQMEKLIRQARRTRCLLWIHP